MKKGTLTITSSSLEPAFKRIEDLLLGHWMYNLGDDSNLRIDVHAMVAQYIYYTSITSHTFELVQYLVDEYVRGANLRPGIRLAVCRDIELSLDGIGKLIHPLMQELMKQLVYSGELLQEVSIDFTENPKLLLITIEMGFEENESMSNHQSIQDGQYNMSSNRGLL